MTTPRIPAQDTTAVTDHGQAVAARRSRNAPAAAKTKTVRASTVASSTPRQTAAARTAPMSVPATPASSEGSCSPMSRNTAFSSRNAMVCQLVASAIRDAPLCSAGEPWASSSPVTTTARTPEAPTASAGRKATNGAAKDRLVSSTGSSIRLRSAPSTKAASTPTTIPPAAASPNRHATSPNPTGRVSAATAVVKAASAVASLTRLSSSSSAVSRRGIPTRRLTAVVATASGGATTAPIASPAARVMPGTIHHAARPTAIVLKATAPTDRISVETRLALKSTSEVRMAAA